MPQLEPVVRRPNWAEERVLRWLARHHGVGDLNQYMFYRCEGCRRVVTWHRIRAGGCQCLVSTRLRPARLRWWEKLRLLVLPWTV